jgi:transaldolase
VVIKIPLTEQGITAIHALKKIGISTNATLVFSANQALLAARAGASFVSPFIGRVDDVGNDGLILLNDILSIFNRYNIDTEVIAASIRHPMHVIDSAKLGSHIATIPYKIIKQMAKHPLTDAGIKRFLEDWEVAF